MDREKLHSKVELFQTGGEISYSKDASVAKFLLGGLGTGNIAVGPRGELRDWEIFNWPGKGRGERTGEQDSGIQNLSAVLQISRFLKWRACGNSAF